MDSLTHIVLGAAIGEAVLGKKIGRKAMLMGAIADTIPDLDVFASPCFSEAEQLLVHRGITHSFFFVILMSIFLGWIVDKWQKKDNVGFKGWTLLFFLGMLSHILLDSLTAYGTAWFEPFSNYRVSFNTIFVADPFYTLPFLVCVLIAIIAKNGSPKRIRWNKIGLWISSAYLLFTIFNHVHVKDVMHTSFEEQGLVADEFEITPTPLNNFLWMAYTRDATGTHIGYYSVFDKTKDIYYYHVNRNDSLLDPYKDDPEVELLKRFSMGHYTVSLNDGVYFNDIRFGQVGGWDGPQEGFAFAYKLDSKNSGERALDRGRMKMSLGEAFEALVERIKGR